MSNNSKEEKRLNKKDGRFKIIKNEKDRQKCRRKDHLKKRKRIDKE